MTTTMIEPVLAPARNENGGIVPPWLQNPIGLYPMPKPPAEQQDEDE